MDYWHLLEARSEDPEARAIQDSVDGDKIEKGNERKTTFSRRERGITRGNIFAPVSPFLQLFGGRK